MSKIYLESLEFYITNVCNLTCETCRTFSNYNFSGHFEFDQTAMQKWADKVDIGHIEILGGEPLLHPRLATWVNGITKLWPEADTWITTNGTRLSKVRGLHELLYENKCKLKISAHGNNLRETIAREIFLTFGACEVLSVNKHSHFGCINSISFLSKLGVKIELQNGNHLQDICFVDKKFNLRRSDPVAAHENCGIRNCHHMIDNKIFKCSVLGLLPRFFEQKGLDVNQIRPYRGLEAEEVTPLAIKNLEKAVPHCSICPESNQYRPIISNFKKRHAVP